MAEGLADCINNTVCASITANHVAPPCLIVTAPEAPVEVCVGVAGFPPDCCVSAGLTCTFNPDLVELILAEQDCNGNGIDDAIDIFLETSQDENNNGVPDECEEPDEIPAVSVWGLVILTMLLLTVMKVFFGRQPAVRRHE